MAFRRTTVPKPKIEYLNLVVGLTTFTIEAIERFRYVHFIYDSSGLKRKKFCVSSGCSHCSNGSPRNLRMTMQVTHNGDLKTLEIGSVLANRIVSDYSVGDTLTLERRGTGLRTTYDLTLNYQQVYPKVGPKPAPTSLRRQTYREEGIKELMYDLQRTSDYDEKYDLIKDFSGKY